MIINMININDGGNNYAALANMAYTAVPLLVVCCIDWAKCTVDATVQMPLVQVPLLQIQLAHLPDQTHYSVDTATLAHTTND